MKSHFKKFSMLVLAFTVFVSPFATQAAEGVPAKENKGFQLGFEVNALTDVGFDVAAPKLDFIAGYRFNDYISLNADLWTVYFVAYGIEINPRLHIPTQSRVSPYLSATFGYVNMTVLESIVEDLTDSEVSLLTFSAGPGLDIVLTERATLNVGIKYRGLIAVGGGSSEYGSGLEAGVGVRWMF